MQRLGITACFDPFQNRFIADLIRTADLAGYRDAWSSESFGVDAFSPLAAAAMLSSSMRLGTAIVPAYTRPPALIAMSAATVNQLSNGRFVLGLGISTPTIVENWMGLAFEKPHTRIRETVAALRAILKGERVTTDGEAIRIKGFRMDIESELPPPPIYLGAQSSAMLRLAGEIGDGIIVNFVTPDKLPAMLDHARIGRRAAGKNTNDLDVVCRIIVACNEDEAAARSTLRRSLTGYLTVPQYNKFFREIGYENEAVAAMEFWKQGDRRKAVESVPDHMIESIYVFGDAKTCRARIDEFFRAGVTTTSLSFVSFAKDPQDKRAKILKAVEDIGRA